MPTTQEVRVGGEIAPRGEVKTRVVRRPSPSGISGLILGGVAGAAIAGPPGAAVGMAIGGAAGVALDHYLPSKPEGDATGA